MPSLVSSFPLGGMPMISPRSTALSLYLVTTVSPSATCSSMVKLVVEKASWISAIVRLKSSRVGPCPGIRLRSTKSGLRSSSMTSRFPLINSSKKRRTRALFSSADTELPPPCQLAFLYRVDNMSMMPPRGVRCIDRRLTEVMRKAHSPMPLCRTVSDLPTPGCGTPFTLHKLTAYPTGYDSLSTCYGAHMVIQKPHRNRHFSELQISAE